MRLVSFKVHTETRVGALHGGGVVDLNSAYALTLEGKGKDAARRHADALIPGCMVGFLEGGDESMKAAKTALKYAEKHPDAVGLDEEKIVLSSDEAKLLAPVPRPGKLYCAAANFYDHATERIKDPEERSKAIERLKSLKLDIPDMFQKPPPWWWGPATPS